MGSDLNTVKSASYEIALDNNSGLTVRFEKKKPLHLKLMMR